MKIIRSDLKDRKKQIVVLDTDQQFGLVHIEVGTMQFAIQEKDGALYLNMTDSNGLDQIMIYPHAANAVTLGSGRYEKKTA